MHEVKYINGPIIYRNRYPTNNDKYWMGLQPILTINQWQETELLLYWFLTDSYQPGTRDSFGGKLKVFMSYNTLSQLTNLITEKYKLVRDQLQSGLSIQQEIVIKMNKNIHLLIGGHQTQYHPVVVCGFRNVSEDLEANTTFTIAKFDELVYTLQNIKQSWHSLHTTLYFNFVEIGKAIRQYMKLAISNQQEILRRLEAIEQKIDQKAIQEVYSPKNNLQEEVNNEIDEPLEPDVIVEETDSVPDTIISSLGKLMKNETESNNENLSILPTLKLPIKSISKLIYLYPHIPEIKHSVTKFVEEHSEDLKELLSKKLKIIHEKDCRISKLIHLLLMIIHVFEWLERQNVKLIIDEYASVGKYETTELSKFENLLLSHILDELNSEFKTRMNSA